MKEFFKNVRFIHVFTLLIAGSVFAFDLLLAFHDLPKENKSIIDFIAGVLNGTCLSGAVAYWLSSTASSKERTKQLIEMAATSKATDK